MFNGFDGYMFGYVSARARDSSSNLYSSTVEDHDATWRFHSSLGWDPIQEIPRNLVWPIRKSTRFIPARFSDSDSLSISLSLRKSFWG